MSETVCKWINTPHLSEKLKSAFNNSVVHFISLDFFLRNAGNATSDEMRGLALQVFCLPGTNIRYTEESPVTDRKRMTTSHV